MVTSLPINQIIWLLKFKLKKMPRTLKSGKMWLSFKSSNIETFMSKLNEIKENSASWSCFHFFGKPHSRRNKWNANGTDIELSRDKRRFYAMKNHYDKVIACMKCEIYKNVTMKPISFGRMKTEPFNDHINIDNLTNYRASACRIYNCQRPQIGVYSCSTGDLLLSINMAKQDA